jgi:hypothetical protein
MACSSAQEDSCRYVNSKARCLRVSKTERYGLRRICFKMTRQAIAHNVFARRRVSNLQMNNTRDNN